MNKTIYGLLTVLLLMYMPFSSAINFGDWMYSGDAYTVDGRDYELFHEFGEDKVFLSVDGKSLIIRLNGCTEYSGLEYCFTEMEEDLDSSSIKYSEGEVYAGLKITSAEVKPEVGITREASKKELKPGESAKVTVTLENTGNRYVDYYEYSESFPPEIQLLESDSGSNDIIMKGGLSPGQRRNIIFSILAKEKVTYESRGYINYTYKGKSYITETDVIEFKVIPEYFIDLKMPDSVELGSSFAANISIENNADEDLVVDYIEFDPGSLIISSADSNWTQTADRISWAGNVLSGDKKKLELILKAEKISTHKPVLKAGFGIGGQNKKYEKEFSVKTLFENPVMKLSLDKEEIVSGSDVTLKMDVDNSNKIQLEFTDMKISAFGKSIDYPTEFVQPESDETIAEKILSVPDVESQSDFDIFLNGNYKTQWGESFSFSKRVKISVSPRNDSLIVSLDFPINASPGEGIEGNVLVENTGDESYSVDIMNSIDPEIDEEQTENLEIGPSSSGNIKYGFSIPSDFEGDSITVRTEINSESLNYSSEKLTVINILLPEINMSINESFGNSSDEEEDPEENEANSGFIVNFVVSVKDFFSWVGSLF